MATDLHVKDQIAEYVLGILADEEAITVIEHLAVCAECREELAGHQQVLATLMLSAPAAEPSPDAREGLMARIAGPKTARPRRTFSLGALLNSRLPAWAGLALGGLVIVLAALLLFQNAPLVPPQAPLHPVQQEAQQTNPYLIKLEATDRMPQARGAVLIRTDGQQAILIVNGLEPLENLDYQLWLTRDDAPVSAGYFTVSDSGLLAIPLTMPDVVFSYLDMKVTIEPAGGSRLPTGTPVMRGFMDLAELLRLFE